jgi:capsular exopolysaccharide synthesis family protein
MTQTRKDLDHARLAILGDPNGAAAEAYRTLSVNIRFGGFEPPARTILFTSATEDEDASTTAANVAVAAAQMNTTVALIDANLRRPMLQETFGLPNAAGLTTLGEGHDTPIQASSFDRLRIVTSGPPTDNPSELLGSDRLMRLLTTLAQEADLVLMAACPVNAAADASLLAVKVDSVVLVIDANHTRRQDARRARAQLERVRARVLGVVLNNASTDASRTE